MKHSNKINSYMGYIAGSFTSFAFIPQVISVYKTRNTKALSLLTLILFFIGQILWITHGYYQKDNSIMTFAIITGVFYIFLIFAKMRY